MSTKKIDLINQLLAKAEQTTPEEAEALMAAAEKLMIKYAIDQSILDSRKAKKGEASEKIIQQPIQFTGAYRGEMLNLCTSVVYGLGNLRGLQNTTANGGKTFTYYIIGFESDVQQALLLIKSLQLQAAIAVREWWKGERSNWVFDTSYNQEKARRSFVHGFGTGAGTRIHDARAVILDAETKGTELVLVDRKAKVDEWVDGMKTKRGRGRNATGQDNSAVSGYRAGREANTGGKAVGNRKGIES